MTSEPEVPSSEPDVEAAAEASTAPADQPTDAPGGDAPVADAAAADPAEAAAAAESAEAEVRRQLAERTADLQRLQAEYLNYKRRVDRDREATRSAAAASVLSSLLSVLDDIGRAEQHGELTGGFKAVADSLRQAVAAHGLEAFGADGDPFDPKVHEALMHGYSSDVDRPTADRVLQVGYRIGDRVVRPARVSVVEPGEPDVSDDEPDEADTAVESTDAR